MSTGSATPRTETRKAKRRVEPVPPALAPDPRKDADRGPGERARVVLVVVSAVLIGLTSGAIASASPWLVAVYAAVMVLIFALPRGENPEREQTSALAETPIRQEVEPRGGKRHRRDAEDRAGRDDRGGADASIPHDATTEASPSPLPSPSPSRRTRLRPRKGAKSAAESSSALAPERTAAAWLQVGPGKFVRADAQNPAAATTPEAHAPIEAAETSLPEVAVFDPAETRQEPLAPEPATEETHAGAAPDGPREAVDPAEPAQSDVTDHFAQDRIRRPTLCVRAVGRSRTSFSNGLRNVSSGTIRPGSARVGLGASKRWRARPTRCSGRLSRLQRHYLPRSPPRRS